MYPIPFTMALAGLAVVVSTSSSSLPTGWSFGGCMILDHFEENISPPYVDTLDSSSMTIELCLATCSTPYAGIDADKCYCGTAPFPALDPTLNYECNMPCPGDASETCGGATGFGWISLYSYSRVGNSTSSSSASSTPSPSSTSSLSSASTLASISTSSAPLSYTTSTIYSTSTETITSCEATVTNCPARTSTTVYVVGTTIVPCSSATTTSSSTSTVLSPTATVSASTTASAVTTSSPITILSASTTLLTTTSTGSNSTVKASATPTSTSVPFTGDASIGGRWGSGMILFVVGMIALL